MGRLPRAISARLTVVAVLAACSSDSENRSSTAAASAKVYCAKSELGCRCSTEAFSLGQDETPVDACREGTWQCCYDLDAAGESTSCECSTYVCAHIEDSDECNCDFVPGVSTLGPSDVRQDNCVKTEQDSLCCESKAPESGHPCSCNGYYGSCEGRPGYESIARSARAPPPRGSNASAP